MSEIKIKRCSFCRKPSTEVSRLFVDIDTSICLGCVELCLVINKEEEAKKEKK